MIHWFDHSTRMAGTKPVIVQAHTDGFPEKKIITELKKFTNLVEENLASNESSSSGKSNATSLKILLAKEMANEVEPKRSAGVIARLMGLEEDLPAKESIVRHARSDTPIDSDPIDSKAVNKAQWKEHQSIRLMTQGLQQFHEYKDVYEVCEDQSGTSFFEDQTTDKLLYSENKSDQSDIVQEKFMEPKCFVMGDKLSHTKDLQEGLKIPSSNNDSLRGLPEEFNPSLSRRLSRFHTNQAPPQTKRITVLKPVSSAEISGVRQSQTERVNRQNGLKMGHFHQSASSKEETTPQSSRIIVLRPTPGRSGISKAKLTPRTTLHKCNSPNDLAYETTIDPSGLVHWHDGYHQRDESLLSSAQSSGYMGDESSCCDSDVGQSSGSEIDYIDETGGSSDSEGCYPLKHSWNYIRGDEGPYSGSFGDVAHFLDSSIIREAKKQLSERWVTVTCKEICEEKQQSLRRTRTLGELLSIQELKNEICTDGTGPVSTERSCGKEKEPPGRSTHIAYGTTATSPMKLPRGYSSPLISPMFDNMAANVQLSNPDSYKQKIVVVSDKGKLSFKGRVLDFFLSKGKMPRQKSIHHPSDCFAERVVHSRLVDHDFNRDANQKAVHCGDKVDNFSMQISTDTSERTASIDVTASSDCTSGNTDRIGDEGLNSNPDQPSPTSVLDGPSEDSSCNEPEKSGRTSKSTISRSSAAEAVACSLPWDNSTAESQLLRTLRPPSLISDADTDESESHVLVQNIMSSSRLGGAQPSMAFAGWHLPEHPVDPRLCNKILELQEQSSYRRLLFDCVNAALVEIGENALLSVFPCSKAHSRTLRDSSGPDYSRVEVWTILKDWINGARMFVVSKKGDAGIMWNRVVKQEVEGRDRDWVKTMVMQVVDIAEELEGGVMEELVEEAVLDFSACFHQ